MSQRYLGGVITANPTAPTLSNESGVWTLEQQFQYSSTWSPRLIGQSVRLRNSASGYFSRTPASSGNQQTFTISMWIKRGTLGTDQKVLGGNSDTSGNYQFNIGFNSSNQFTLFNSNVYPSDYYSWVSTNVYRDPSAWYHLVLAVDTTQATATNRIKAYINGVQITSWGTQTSGSQNMTFQWNRNVVQGIGAYVASAGQGYSDVYIAEMYNIDGQALTPSSFGAFDTNGIWQPLQYTGTYGTNGFYLTFADNSAATATTLGKDYSGNGNNFTPNNISVTSGVTYDWMLDSPTPYADGGNGRGNYATFNPLAKGSAVTMSDGNLKYSANASSGIVGPVSIYISAGMKNYVEFTCGSASTYRNITVGDAIYIGDSGGISGGTGGSGTFATWTTNDVIGIAADFTAGTVAFYKNNTLQSTVTGVPNTSSWVIIASQGVGTGEYYFNAGQRPFAYTPPTGFVALNTQNLPAVNINNGAQYMAATLYTGNSAVRSISNGANNTIATTFQPDFVWIKNRTSGSFWHQLYDAIRGPLKSLFSNDTSAESTYTDTLTAFASTGFTLGTDATYNGGVNKSGDSYVAWQWKAAGSSVSNTNGSITSTVNAGTTQGFSVVTFTVPSSGTATVGHGLGVAPSFILVKPRSTTFQWDVYHASLGNSAYVVLNSTAAQVTGATTVWNATSPTSTVFSLGTAWSGSLPSATCVAYCWAEVAGFSKFGSYTGNGSTSADGPFVYLGFRPRFIMGKRSDSTGGWWMFDTSRSEYNLMDDYLYANSSDAEQTNITTLNIDVLSNGFKVRSGTSPSTWINANGGTYIYMAFAENPFNLSRAR